MYLSYSYKWAVEKTKAYKVALIVIMQIERLLNYNKNSIFSNYIFKLILIHQKLLI